MRQDIEQFQKEKYKKEVASVIYHCHANSGIFPHINAFEIFIYLGIANGITQLGLDTTPLAIRYLPKGP